MLIWPDLADQPGLPNLKGGFEMAVEVTYYYFVVIRMNPNGYYL